MSSLRAKGIALKDLKQGEGDAEQPRRRADDIARRIAAARDGDSAARAILFDACRQYLLMIANQELDEELRRKIGPSDIVQETLVTAQRGFRRFKGDSEEEMRRWLRRILRRKLANAWRYYGKTAKRDIRREQSLPELPLPGGSDALCDPAPTPVSTAISDEQARLVKSVMQHLPEHYQMLIGMRSFERRSFQEIGMQMDISADAARKAWGRAIARFVREWRSRYRDQGQE